VRRPASLMMIWNAEPNGVNRARGDPARETADRPAVHSSHFGLFALMSAPVRADTRGVSFARAARMMRPRSGV
jgi:hypothetical protein